MTAREDMLTSIRASLVGPKTDSAVLHRPIERRYRRFGRLANEDCVQLFINRLADYDADTLQVESEDHLPNAIADALQPINKKNEKYALVAPTFPIAWLPLGFNFRPDHDLPIDVIEGAQAVVTTCEAAVASTGTLILVHHGNQARRVLTLLPDYHICLVRRDQVFELLPAALEVVVRNVTCPITMISGPSATSDIEMIRVRGVHGPRHLTIVLYGSLVHS